MVTAVCNIFLGTKKKLIIFKQTLPSVFDVSDNWLIYIRGKYRREALKFVRETLDSNGINSCIFDQLNDLNWAESTLYMIKKSSRHKYIYIYLEDHWLISSLDEFRQVIADAVANQIDYFQYSFFNVGLSAKTIEIYYPDGTKYFYTIKLHRKLLPRIRKTNRHFYPFSLVGVASKDFFLKLLEIERKRLIKVPFIIQTLMENVFFFYPRNRAFWFRVNKLAQYLGIRFVMYPLSTPFNLEKSLFDCDEELLPIKVGVLKKELFANWDDDNKLFGSSLIKRGLYPMNFKIRERQDRPSLDQGKDYFLKSGQKTHHQYYPDINRLARLPAKYIYVKKGSIRVSARQESFILRENGHVWVYANIPHDIIAQEDCDFQIFINGNVN